MQDLPQALLQLRQRLGPTAVLWGDDVPVRNHNDWSSQAPIAPLVLVRPSDTAGVADALRTCHGLGWPVVPQGGLTGLSGGARPSAGSVALSLERMVGVEDLDRSNATLTALAGTPLQQVQQAAEEAGFQFALDLGARGSCSIGGNLATNAGGNRVIRYGMARDLVLGLEVVLADGTVMCSLNKMLKNNAGYDLKHCFIGSEGTLGVITRAVLRLHPKPGCVWTAVCALRDFGAVEDVLAHARARLGPMLSAFEVMWPDYWHQATGPVGLRNPLPGAHGMYALIEAQGMDEGLDRGRFDAWLEQAWEDGLVEEAAMARSVGDAQAFWSLRDACGEFPRVIGPHVAYDIGLPLRDMDACVRRCKQALDAAVPGCQSVYYGHVGDGNIHIDAWVPGRGEGQPKAAMDAVVYRLVQAFEGTVSAEHGIGTTKRGWLPVARSPQELALMRQIKQALDPRGLLNPGKVL